MKKHTKQDLQSSLYVVKLYHKYYQGKGNR